MTSTASAVPNQWRRLVCAASIAAAATIGGTAFGDLAVASAEPREWDIANYDECVRKVNAAEWKGEISAASGTQLRRECCTRWGGIAAPTPEGGFQCVAPPKEAAGRTIPPGVITNDLTPAPVTLPSGDITQIPVQAP